MKFPKKVKDYCKKCNSHTEHKIKEFKSRPARKHAVGQRKNVEKKRGYGGKFQFIATVKKSNKRPTFIAECSQCKTKHYISLGKRQKKVELVTA